jgi:nucleoside 2-deoxyribosyltransferase
MKIYFAGSIRGGREDVNIYREIVTLLQTYGEVLSEHIADESISSYGQVTLTNEEIYNKDVNWINESDVIVAEVTSPSLGVGYELGYSEAKGKKIIALYREQEGKRLSAMVSGNKNITVYTYTEVSELQELFKKLLS